MIKNACRAGVAAIAALAVCAPGASAETFETSFGPEQKNEFAWDGNVKGTPAVPTPLGWFVWGCFDQEPIGRCDRVVFDIQAKGDLDVAIDLGEVTSDPEGTVGYPDADIFLYEGSEGSDAEGA